MDTGGEGRIGRIVEICKCKILPDQKPVFIRQSIERIGLVEHRAARSQEVHAGFASELEKRLRLFTRSAERHEIRLRPAGAARKYWHAVYHQLEAVARRAAVYAQFPEADAPKLDHFMVGKFERDAMQRRFTVRMRPPARHIRNPQRARKRLRIAPLQRYRRIVANKPPGLFMLRMDKAERQVNQAVVSIEARMQLHAINR